MPEIHAHAYAHETCFLTPTREKNTRTNDDLERGRNLLVDHSHRQTR